MPRTLYARLALALLALLGLLGALYVALAVYTTRLHVQEVTQRLHQGLAANIVGDRTLMLDQQIDQAALEDTFHMLMVVNPSIEVYLLDPKGRIIGYSAPPGEVVRDRVALAPIAAFLGGDIRLPLLGDDPRDERGQKVFSAASISDAGGQRRGYLYIVLGGERYDSIAGLFEQSYVLRLGTIMAAGGLLLALASGFIAFHWLTRRLRVLGDVVRDFERGDHVQPIRLPDWRRGPRGDEIDRLGIAFEQMAERIVEQVRALRHADAARRELITQVSHDLRTPLASLQGYLETLLIRQSALSLRESRQHLEQALRHCHRLGRLIDELFELATLESARAELHFEPFSLAELVQDVAQKFQLEADKRGIRLATTIPEAGPFVWADIARIERVLDNLIDNAIKYTPAGGAVELSVAPERDHVRVAVADTGTGIPEVDLPRIFERFYRAPRPAAGEVEGTGLGLAIARRILDLHGAAIEVASRLGAGTTFAFRLPVADLGSRERVPREGLAMPA